MLQKPKRLEPGDTIGIVAPSFKCPNKNLADGLEHLKELGYKIKMRPGLNKGWGYMADTDKNKANDIMKMFTDPKVDAIICTRGGWGSMKLWSMLDWKTISRNPKIFSGFSDITSLHIALNQKGNMLSFHGPMAGSCLYGRVTQYTEKLFWRVLSDSEPLGELPLPGNKKLTKINGGKATGILAGGNISLVAASMGTPFQVNFKGKILFLEEVGERIYCLDRYFSQIFQSGAIKGVKGLILGEFLDCKPDKSKNDFTINQIIEQYFKPLRIPILADLPFGHGKQNAVMPVGLRVTLDADRKKLIFLEGAVR